MERQRAVVPTILLCAIGAALLCGPRIVDAQSEGSVDVLENRAEYAFAERLAFTLEAESDRAIVDVVLRYSVEGDLPVNRRLPEFDPGQRVRAVHEESIQRGQIPPAAAITWWWTLTDASDRVTETPRREIRYLDDRFDWRSQEADGVRVWWYGDHGAQARSVAQTARGVMDRLARLVGSTAAGEVEIVTYAGQADMRPSLAERGEAYEARLATLGARVAPHILLLDVETRSGELEEILAHELSHLVLGMHFGREYIDAPLWLEEGLAMYVEGPLDPDERALLEEAQARDALMSVRSLTSFPGRAELVPLAYAQSRDIVDYLIETHGTGPFRAFVNAIAGGRLSTDEALMAVYGVDQSTLYQAYRIARGLGPAATPVPGQGAGARTGGLAAPCLSLALVAPAVVLAARRRDREGGPRPRRPHHALDDDRQSRENGPSA